MPRIAHFEIPADDLDRAVEFYSSAFDWDLKKYEGVEDYWLVTTGESSEPGIDGAIYRRNEDLPVTTNTVVVPSVDDYIERVQRAGGRVTSPKQELPGVGVFAYCADPDGNIFGLYESLEGAS